MLDSLFDIAVDTPKYHRRGTLSLVSSGEGVEATLKIGDLDAMTFSGTCSGQELDFEGNRDLPGFGQVDFKAHGSVWGNSVSVTCVTDAGKAELFGTRLSTAAGGAVSSHEYLMRASTGDVSDADGTMYSGLYADGG